MEYNYRKIGEIISKERKAAGFKSQDALITHLSNNYGYSMGRNTLSAIENGKTRHYDCELLYIFCEIFNCEIGYLLGEYDCKTGRNTDISKETGLNEDAVNKICSMQFDNNASGYSDILTLLINHPNFIYTLSLLANDATGACESIVFGNSKLVLDRKAIINSELKDVIIEIASDIRKNYKPDKNAMMHYNFLNGLLHEDRITYEQYKDIKKEYDKGNFDYVPKDMHINQ